MRSAAFGHVCSPAALAAAAMPGVRSVRDPCCRTAAAADAPSVSPHAKPDSATALARSNTRRKIGAVVAPRNKCFRLSSVPVREDRTADRPWRGGRGRPEPVPATRASTLALFRLDDLVFRRDRQLVSLDSRDAALNDPPLTLALMPSALTFSPLLFSNSVIACDFGRFFLEFDFEFQGFRFDRSDLRKEAAFEFELVRATFEFRGRAVKHIPDPYFARFQPDDDGIRLKRGVRPRPRRCSCICPTPKCIP